MALDGRLLGRARARLAGKKEQNTALREAREAEVRGKIPALRRIDAEQRSLMGEVLDLTLNRRADTAAARVTCGTAASAGACWRFMRRSGRRSFPFC